MKIQNKTGQEYSTGSTSIRLSAADLSKQRARRDSGADLAILLSILLGGFIFVVAGRSILPPRYSLDQQKIQWIAQRRVSFREDESFQLVGELYRVLGLANHPTAAGVMGYLMYAAALTIAIGSPTKHQFHGADWTAIALSVSFGAVYMGTYSKDVFLLPIVYAFLLSKNTLSHAATVTAVAGYASLFRSYWFLVLGIAVVLRFAYSGRRPYLVIPASVLSTYVALAVIFEYRLGVELDTYRNVVNSMRLGSIDVGSTISPLLPVRGLAGGVLNTALTLITFALPLPLVLAGGAFYAAISVSLATIWGLFLRAAIRLRKLADKDATSTAWIVGLVLALAVVQSIFEPDYGSYVRHLTPITPLMLVVIRRSRERHMNNGRGG